MNAPTKLQPLLEIMDHDFAAGYEEAQLAYFADCMSLIETARAMHTEYLVEIGLSEQQLRQSTGFIIGIPNRG